MDSLNVAAPADFVCRRALRMLIAASTLLDEIVERGEVERGSPPDVARGYLDDAIGMLAPDEVGVAHG